MHDAGRGFETIGPVRFGQRIGPPLMSIRTRDRFAEGDQPSELPKGTGHHTGAYLPRARCKGYVSGEDRGHDFYTLGCKAYRDGMPKAPKKLEGENLSLWLSGWESEQQLAQSARWARHNLAAVRRRNAERREPVAQWA